MPLKITVLDAITIGVEILRAALLALDNGGSAETPIDPEALKINKSAQDVLAEIEASRKK